MPVLPLIDALIFAGWSSLMVSFVLVFIGQWINRDAQASTLTGDEKQ